MIISTLPLKTENPILKNDLKEEQSSPSPLLIIAAAIAAIVVPLIAGFPFLIATGAIALFMSIRKAIQILHPLYRTSHMPWLETVQEKKESVL